MPPRFTDHLRARMRRRRITEEDVRTVLQRPMDEVYDPENRSYKLYGRTTDGRKIYIAVKDTTLGTDNPVIKSVVEVD
ncbi:DUF4258 domain-containing protein [Nocardiopsis sp. CC223A]|uniref:DUF4258 domain-containing protein n=1 Tax=Nocardiopsis sp. CC223A TaxID=3044051 RepID=UPI00278C8BDD|nr:DUF4258 domain-containing protein [Nocardiopsis sp. CC223A]